MSVSDTRGCVVCCSLARAQTLLCLRPSRVISTWRTPLTRQTFVRAYKLAAKLSPTASSFWIGYWRREMCKWRLVSGLISPGSPASYTNAQRLICRIGVPLVDSGFITATAQCCRCVLATSGPEGRAVLLFAQGLRPCTADTSRRTGRDIRGRRRGRRDSVEGGGLCGGAVSARALGRLLRGLLVSGQRGMGCESC